MRKKKKRIINRQLHDRGYSPNYFRKVSKWMQLHLRGSMSGEIGRVENFDFYVAKSLA